VYLGESVERLLDFFMVFLVDFVCVRTLFIFMFV